MIELKDVYAGYGKKTVLDGVSAIFEKGRMTSIIGINGSGKSTLLKVMLGILPLSGGRVFIDGCALCDMTRRQTALKAAYLSQGKDTPDMTAQQLVLHGRFPHLTYPRQYKEQDYRIASEAMEMMGVAGYAGMSLHDLSGGMRQNAYIAMALAQETDYILLDEPATYLDIAHQLGLMETLHMLSRKGKGIVMVMHDLPMAFRFSDDIVVLDAGKVCFAGSPEQICENGVTEKIFGVAVGPLKEGQNYGYKY